MFSIYEIMTGKRLNVSKEVLLIYCRKFNDGYVIYGEILKLESGRSLRLNQNGLSTHIFIRPDDSEGCAIQQTLIKLN